MNKIIYAAPTYLPSRRANTFQVMKMAGALVELGQEVDLVVPLPGGRHSNGSVHPPEWTELAIHYGLSVDFIINWLPVNSLWRSYDFGFKAASHAAHQGADLVYTRHPQTAAIAGMRGLRTILEAHDYPQGTAGPWLFRQFLKSNGAVRLVSISRALLTDLERDFHIPAAPFPTVEPDGVDIERFVDLPEPSAARKRVGLPEQFTAAYTGHLYAGRGIETIIELAGRLPLITFLIAGGNTEDVDRIRESSANLENLVLTGFIPNADLPRYQAAADVLLMPYEEKVAASSGGNIAAYLSPMKLFEYLASGRPILSSNLPVLKEVLDEHLAILLPPGDINAWETALLTLQSDPARRTAMGTQGKRVAIGYSWKARGERILDGLR